MPDASVDAVVTDPPYGIGFKYRSHDDDPKKYDALITAAVSDIRRLVRPGGLIAIWQASKNIHRFGDWFGDSFYTLAACKNFVQIYASKPVCRAWDPVVVWWNGVEPKGSVNPGSTRDFLVGDTSPSGRKKRNEANIGHPCPRPIMHTDWIIQTWTREGETVLDPFAGSGTTGVSCLTAGRSFIGIEREAEYCEIARARIAGAAPKKAEALPGLDEDDESSIPF